MLAERQASNGAHSETPGVSIDFPGVQCVSPTAAPLSNPAHEVSTYRHVGRPSAVSNRLRCASLRRATRSHLLRDATVSRRRVYTALTALNNDEVDMALVSACDRLLDSLLAAATEAGGWPETGSGLLRQVSERRAMLGNAEDPKRAQNQLHVLSRPSKGS
jgi:hypothetical protein